MSTYAHMNTFFTAKDNTSNNMEQFGSWVIPKRFSSVTAAIVGVGLSVWLIANPHTATTLASYIHFTGIFLVTIAILGFGAFMPKSAGNQVSKLTGKPTPVANDSLVIKAAA